MRVLILGGLPQHISIVERVKQRGHIAVVTDDLQDSAAKRVADIAASVSTTDISGLVDLCRRESVDGIIAGVSDASQRPFYEVSRRLDLPVYGSKVAFGVLTDKERFFMSCDTYGVPHIPTATFGERQVDWISSRPSFPLVVKPVDGRAGRGISTVRDLSGMDEAIRVALLNSARRRFQVQPFLTGTQVCAKYFVVNGRPVLTSLSDLHIKFEANNRVYIGAIQYPSKHAEIFLRLHDESLRSLIQGLQIDFGPVSFTGVLHSGQVLQMDPSFRLGGAMQWRVEEHASGISVVDDVISFATKEPHRNASALEAIWQALRNESFFQLYVLLRPGTIESIVGIDDVANIAEVCDVHVIARLGDQVPAFGTAKSVLARILLKYERREQLRELIRDIHRFIKVTDTGGNSQLLSPIII